MLIVCSNCSNFVQISQRKVKRKGWFINFISGRLLDWWIDYLLNEFLIFDSLINLTRYLLETTYFKQRKMHNKTCNLQSRDERESSVSICKIEYFTILIPLLFKLTISLEVFTLCNLVNESKVNLGFIILLQTFPTTVLNLPNYSSKPFPTSVPNLPNFSSKPSQLQLQAFPNFSSKPFQLQFQTFPTSAPNISQL